MRLLKSKGFDVTRKDVLNYIDAAEEYIEIARDQTGEDYSVQDWYKETKANYPEDLRALKKDLDESRLTEAPLTPAEYAARARARKAKKDSEEENGESILYKINAKLDPDMSVTDQLQVFFDELVPASGPAETQAGELVRSMMRILYRDFNDGDLWYTGYGKETCGPSVLYIIKTTEEDFHDEFQEIADRNLEDEAYTDALEEITYHLIEYLNNHPEEFTTPRIEDSRSYGESLETYFDLPTYEFDVDASYDESYYDVSDDDIDQFIHDVVESDFRGATVNRWASDAWTIEGLDKDQLEYLEDVWERWFNDFLSQHEREEEPEEDEEEYYDEDDE